MLQVNRRQLLKAGGALGAVSTMSPVVMASAGEADLSGLPRVKQELVAPPFVPAHEQTTMDGPKIIEVELIATEEMREIDDDGTTYHTTSFNGWIPGPLMICHEGDYIELTLKNPEDNVFEHNIDFHASTGALGGGGLTHVQPGEQVMLRWKAVKPGTFIYHCAPGGSMIPYHVVSGMNGAVMVLPRDGLKDRHGNPLSYDRAYYVGEQDFYVPRDADGNYMEYETHGDAMADIFDVMHTLLPTHVVFNGKVGALTGDGAMTANVGETVLFIHSQANRDSQAAPDRRPRRLCVGTGLVSPTRRRKASRPGSSAAARPVRRSIPSASRAPTSISPTTSSRPSSWARWPSSACRASGTTT